MKKIILFFVLCVIVSLNVYSQFTVYYYSDNKMIEMNPVTPNTEMTGFMKKTVNYTIDEKRSDNILCDTNYIYIKVPNSYSIKNFKLVSFEIKKNKRKVKWISASILGYDTNNEKISSLKFEKINDYLYKFHINNLDYGCYGIFYNFSNNFITNIYDFDVKK